MLIEEKPLHEYEHRKSLWDFRVRFVAKVWVDDARRYGRTSTLYRDRPVIGARLKPFMGERAGSPLP